jgi:hypothetical protein
LSCGLHVCPLHFPRVEAQLQGLRCFHCESRPTRAVRLDLCPDRVTKMLPAPSWSMCSAPAAEPTPSAQLGQTRDCARERPTPLPAVPAPTDDGPHLIPGQARALCVCSPTHSRAQVCFKAGQGVERRRGWRLWVQHPPCDAAPGLILSSSRTACQRGSVAGQSAAVRRRQKPQLL